MASTTVQDIPDRLAPAYRECIALARSHYENFTVAGRFLPKRLLPHVAAIYAYCRGVDDLGDEAAGDRLALLDAWEADLEQAYAGTPTAPHLQALQHTIRAFAIPPEPFRKLITANRMDQTQSRYATFADVLHYCEHSANPVGFLYLLLFGYDDEERRRLSDATCTALQLANFWQDVRRDWDKGRVYLPQEDMERFGYTEESLPRASATRPFAISWPGRWNGRKGSSSRGCRSWSRWRARRGCTSSSSAWAACECWTPSGRKTTMSSQSGRWSPDAARHGSWRRRTLA